MSAALSLASEDWLGADGEMLRSEQERELAEKYGRDDYEPGIHPTADDIVVFVVARNGDGQAVGCGALRKLSQAEYLPYEPSAPGQVAEIKRMYVRPECRGSGAAVAILKRLESEAVSLGVGELLLEAGAEQPDAVRFYQREGYRPIERFGHYSEDESSLCFARTLQD